jgi:hypothetical protein
MPESRRRILQTLFALGAAAGASMPALAGYNIFTETYTVPRADIVAQITKRFPLRLRYASIFEVQLTHPRVEFDATANRLRIAVDALIANPLFLPQPMPGVLALSSALKYDAASRAVRLDQPDADRVALQGLSGRDAEQLQALGSVVAQQVLRDYPLHTFGPEDLRYGNRTFEPGAITVTAEGVTVQLH